MAGGGDARARRIEIGEAESPADIAEVERLVREFAAWCMVRYAERLWMPELYFQEPAFSESLSRLAEEYSAPHGAMLLARVDGAAGGTISYRAIAPGVCEMKRAYVAPAFQGLGLGRQLGEALIGLARQRGFTAMRLEAGDLQPEAHALYRKLGFTEIAPYGDHPKEMEPYLLFMEKAL